MFILKQQHGLREQTHTILVLNSTSTVLYPAAQFSHVFTFDVAPINTSLNCVTQ